MAEYRNPPLLASAPADGQLLQYTAASDTWAPVSAASVGTLTVPGTHIAGGSAPSAQTGATVATANAATQTSSYVQADVQTIAALANALKTDYNKTITDVGTLITELTADVAKLATLLTELQTAGILASS